MPEIIYDPMGFDCFIEPPQPSVFDMVLEALDGIDGVSVEEIPPSGDVSAHMQDYGYIISATELAGQFTVTDRNSVICFLHPDPLQAVNFVEAKLLDELADFYHPLLH